MSATTNDKWQHQTDLLNKLQLSHGRLLIGDEPGVGKTKPVLDFMRANQSLAVVFVPYNVVLQVWHTQAQRWLGQDVIIYTGKAEDREAFRAQIAEERAAVANPKRPEFGRPVIVVAHISHQQELLTSFKWTLVAYDEYHVMGFCNRKSKTFLTAKELLKKSKNPHIIFMSGTPYKKSLADMWGPLHLIDRTKFRGYWNFVNDHCIVEEDFMGYKHILPAMKNPVVSAEQLRPFMMRRTLRGVMKHLPPVIHDVVELEMTKDQKKLYNDLLKESMALFGEDTDEENLILTPNAISLLTRLRQVLISPQIFSAAEKSLGVGIPAVCELAKIHIDSDEPVAIFTPFRLGVETIQQHLWKDKIVNPTNTYTIIGGRNERGMGVAENFQNDPNPQRILIGTISSAISYTATAARKGIVLGPEHSHVTMQQMIGRLDRANRGDDIPIQFTYFKHRGTIEEKIYSRLTELQSWAEFFLNRDDFRRVED